MCTKMALDRYAVGTTHFVSCKLTIWFYGPDSTGCYLPIVNLTPTVVVNVSIYSILVATELCLLFYPQIENSLEVTVLHQIENTLEMTVSYQIEKSFKDDCVPSNRDTF